MYEFKKFKVLGYTTDFQQCECCGREGLKGTVSILDLNYDTVMHYGTGCAASADKYDTLDAAKEAKKEINNKVNDFKRSVQFAVSIAWKILREKYGRDAHIIAPKNIAAAQVEDCIAFYTNPANKMKAYPRNK